MPRKKKDENIETPIEETTKRKPRKSILVRYSKNKVEVDVNINMIESEPFIIENAKYIFVTAPFDCANTYTLKFSIDKGKTWASPLHHPITVTKDCFPSGEDCWRIRALFTDDVLWKFVGNGKPHDDNTITIFKTDL